MPCVDLHEAPFLVDVYPVWAFACWRRGLLFFDPLALLLRLASPYLALSCHLHWLGLVSWVRPCGSLCSMFSPRWPGSVTHCCTVVVASGTVTFFGAVPRRVVQFNLQYIPSNKNSKETKEFDSNLICRTHSTQEGSPVPLPRCHH